MIQLNLGGTHLNPNSNGGTAEVKKRNNSVPLEGLLAAIGAGVVGCWKPRISGKQITSFRFP
jgi:hypothetical protein